MNFQTLLSRSSLRRFSLFLLSLEVLLFNILAFQPTRGVRPHFSGFLPASQHSFSFLCRFSSASPFLCGLARILSCLLSCYSIWSLHGKPFQTYISSAWCAQNCIHHSSVSFTSSLVPHASLCVDGTYPPCHPMQEYSGCLCLPSPPTLTQSWNSDPLMSLPWMYICQFLLSYVKLASILRHHLGQYP